MKLIAAIAILCASAIIMAACKLSKPVATLKWKGPMPSTHFDDVSKEDEYDCAAE